MKRQVYICSTVCVLIFMIAFSHAGYAQDPAKQFHFWRLMNYSGQINLRGNYRDYNSHYSFIDDHHDELFVNGILQLRTQSFFVHPNFLLVHVNGIYNPETRRQRYLGMPDNSESNNREGVDVSGLFFAKRSYNLVVNASTYTNLQSNDNFSRMREKNSYYGGLFSYRNQVLPFTLGYNHEFSDQKSLDSDRRFKMDQQLFQATATKSFGRRDHHSLNALHTIHKSDQQEDGSVLPYQLKNTTDLIELSDDITLGKRNGIGYASSLSSSREKGDLNYTSNSVQQNLSFRLPWHFNISNSYNYREGQLDTLHNYFNRFQSILSHQIYSSLTSRFTFEHWRSQQELYKEEWNKFGADFRYQKMIPRGKIILSYAYNKEYQHVNASPSTVNVFREPYSIDDSKINLLNNQYINLQSVVVKDQTGNTIYKLNVDYILVDRSPYIEIIRVPGGLIPNNGQVFLDYTVTKPGYSSYIMSSQNFNADIWLFRNILNMYYRMYTQGYENEKAADYQVLNTTTRNVLGFRADYRSLSTGVEYEFCTSNILPYSSWKYFVSYQATYRKFLFVVNGNYVDFKLDSEKSHRRDINIQGKCAYSITSALKLNTEYSYHNMQGNGLDVEIHLGKVDFTAMVRSLFISVGGEMYRSASIGSSTTYRGGYIQITRNF